MSPEIRKREVILVAVTVLCLAFLFRLAWIPADPQSALDRAADNWGLEVGDTGRWFSAWSIGDGQAFAVIASDPLGLDEGWRIGQPAYRYSRVGFGWAAWAVSLGRERFVPMAMALVGAGVLLANLLLSIRLRPHLGRSAWLLILNPAMYIGFAGDTAEGMGLLALSWTIATGAGWAAAILGITRPSYLIALVGRWKPLAWGGASAAILTVMWIVRFGLNGSQYGGGFAPPILGYIEAPSIQSWVLAGAALVTLLVGLRSRDWGWVATAIVVLCFSAAVVEFGVNGWRAAGMLFVLWAFGPNFPPTSLGKTASASVQPT